jgi:two-component system, cell cycle sensor histidine kinase and response regulator CckA
MRLGWHNHGYQNEALPRSAFHFVTFDPMANGFSIYGLNYLAFDDVPAAICGVEGPAHSCVYTNTQFNRLFDRDAVIGQQICTALPQLCTPEVSNLLDRVYSTGEPGRIRELQVSSKFLDLTLQAHRDASGAIDGVLIFGYDESDQVELRRASEAARKQAEANADFLAAVLDTVDEAIIACDANSILTLLNKRTAELHGTPFAAVHALDWAKHSRIYRTDGVTPLPPEEVPLLRAARGERIRDLEVLIARDESSEKRNVMISGQPVHSRDGRLLGAVAVMRDITDERWMQKELRTAELTSALGHIASRMAHEFNNVLMGIQTMLTVISRTVTGEPAAKAIGHIEQAINRGKRITTEVLRMSRAGRPELKSLQVSALLAACEEEVRAQMSPGIIATLEPADDSLWIAGDTSQLQQVFVNLASNANDAMEGVGRLRIETRGDADWVTFQVTDDGQGIDADVLPTIFEPMVTTRRERGHGLGLTIVRQTIRGHGGEIDVLSTPGQGSTFTIRLPRVTAPHAPLAVSHDRTWRGRVLLVEDDDIVASGLAVHLDGAGHLVSRASTGNAALDALDVFKPDLMILDIGLPDISGEVVFDKVKGLRPELPIIIATAHGDEATFAAFLDRQNVAFLSKPFDMNSLDAAIERVTSS